MAFFDDSFGRSDTTSSTLIGTGSGALAGAAFGPAGIAVGAGLGFLAANQANRMARKQRADAEAAAEQERANAQKRRNDLVKQEFNKRRSGTAIKQAGNVAPGQQNASNQGTILTSGAGSQTQTSILGGNNG